MSYYPTISSKPTAWTLEGSICCTAHDCVREFASWAANCYIEDAQVEDAIDAMQPTKDAGECVVCERDVNR